MQAIGVERAHVSGLSLGSAIGLWLASKYPQRVKTLSLHSCWPKTDPFLKVVVGDWQTIAKALGSVQEMVIQGIFPYCVTPELYAAKPDYIDQLRRLRAQPAETAARRLHPSVGRGDGHDALTQLRNIASLILFSIDTATTETYTRFADPFKSGIKNTELVVFENCAHAPIYESVSEFNEKTLAFLNRRTA